MSKSVIQCFMLERTDLAQVSLRRFASGSNCTGTYGYHNASVIIADTVPFAPSDPSLEGEATCAFDRADPRWPAMCGCGYEFGPDDQWQHSLDRLHRAPDGILYTLRAAPPGAMWFSDWYSDHFKCRGPDGRCLCVMLPDGTDWQIDGPANNGPAWTRTGTPPNVTARPSILTSRYHGFLTDGRLEEC